jgi:DNA-directed RNA polymerase subunit RPC12/RpoP
MIRVNQFQGQSNVQAGAESMSHREENGQEKVSENVMFVCMKCGAEVWQSLIAPRICDHCGYQLVANPRRG